jgi:hypothetical protein
MSAIQDDVDGVTYRADEKPVGAPHGDCIGYATPKHEHTVARQRSGMSRVPTSLKP